MDNKKKIKVRSTVSGRVGVNVPSLNFSREWINEGAEINIDREILDQLYYDAGFKYMLEQGMLYIDDMDVKRELGLEPEEAEAPENIIVLNDKDKRRYMVNMSQKEFEEKVSKLPREQIFQLIDYAIENRLADMDKSRYLREKTGKDIVTAIRLNEQNKEG